MMQLKISSIFSIVVGKEIVDKTEKASGHGGRDQSPGTNSVITGSE